MLLVWRTRTQSPASCRRCRSSSERFEHRPPDAPSGSRLDIRDHRAAGKFTPGATQPSRASTCCSSRTSASTWPWPRWRRSLRRLVEDRRYYRGDILLRLADLIEANADGLARLETADTGHPIRDSRNLDVVRTANTFRYFGGMADKSKGDVIPLDAGFLNYVLREPLGVVGMIVPWNCPCSAAGRRPALAAGHRWPRAGRAHAAVGAANRGKTWPKPVSRASVAGTWHATRTFAIGAAVGAGMSRRSAGNLKRVQLELGGKGANIVFGDADIGSSRETARRSRSSTTRDLHRRVAADPSTNSIADDFLRRFIALAESIRIGYIRRRVPLGGDPGPARSATSRSRSRKRRGSPAERPRTSRSRGGLTHMRPTAAAGCCVARCAARRSSASN